VLTNEASGSANGAAFSISCKDTVECAIGANRTGTGSYTPINFYTSAAKALTIGTGSGIYTAGATDKGSGTINVGSNIYLAGTAYTNPDFVLEHWATGKIQQFIGNPGALQYKPFTLQEIADFAGKNYYLPQLDFLNGHTGDADGDVGIRERHDISLILHEDTFRFLFEIDRRLTALEANHAQ